MELFVTKKSNTWEMLLTVVLESFVLNMTAPISDSEMQTWILIQVIKYSIQHLHVRSQQEKTPEQRVKYIQI